MHSVLSLISLDNFVGCASQKVKRLQKVNTQFVFVLICCCLLLFCEIKDKTHQFVHSVFARQLKIESHLHCESCKTASISMNS